MAQMDLIPQLAYELINADGNIWGVCIMDMSGRIVYQTDNWDLTPVTASILQLNEKSGAVEINGVRYVIVEIIPERVIATNVTGKGHIIICPVGTKGKIVCYVKPEAGPRDSLLNVFNYGAKIAAYL